MKKITEKILDIAFSLFIRNRDKRCLRCGSQSKLQCAHIFSRTARSVRWDPLNALTLCWNCHFNWAHRNPVEFTEFVKKLLGRRFAELKRRYHNIKHWTEEEKRSLLKAFKNKFVR